MKIPLSWSCPPLALALGWLAHLAWPQTVKPTLPPETAPPPPVRTTSTPAAPLSPAQPARAISPTTWAELYRYPSEAHRLAALARSLQGFTPAQFAAWHREIVGHVRYEDDLLLRLFFRRWAQVAPREAIAAALAARERNPLEFNSIQPLACAVMTMAETDRAGARAEVARMHFQEADSLRHRLQMLEVPRPGELPPAEALARLRALQEEQPNYTLEFGQALGELIKEWSASGPEVAWRAALAVPPPSQSGQPDMRTMALQAIILQQTAIDPERALALLRSLPDESLRNALMGGYLNALVSRGDLGRANALAQSLPVGSRERASAMASFMESYLASEPNWSTAKALVESLPAADWQNGYVARRILAAMAARDPLQALDFLQRKLVSTQPGWTPGEVANGAFERWIYAEPEAATRAFAALPGDLYHRPLQSSLRAWSNRDSASAAIWAEATLPPGEARRIELTWAVYKWSTDSPEDAARWADSLPPGETRWAAAEAIAFTQYAFQPDQAFAWLQTIPDEAARLRSLQRLWQSWPDRDAAARWRDTSAGLTASERAALR